MKQSTKTLFIILFISLSACQDIIDCIINVRPELPDKVLKTGDIEQYYFDEFNAGIKNEPRDDDYDYYFEFYGDLPEGLEIFFNNKNVAIEGTPIESGLFTFTLYLTVDPPVNYDFETGEYEDSLCSDSTSHKYTIAIR